MHEGAFGESLTKTLPETALKTGIQTGPPVASPKLGAQCKQRQSEVKWRIQDMLQPDKKKKKNYET